MGTVNGRILVIDDEEAVRKSFVLALQKTGCPVDVAESGEKGIEMFRARPYDLVFLDLRMPGLDGLATLRAIRALSPAVPVYIVTAFHQAFLDGLEAAEQAGIVFELLQKPVESSQIRLLAGNILAGSGAGADGRLRPQEQPAAAADGTRQPPATQGTVFQLRLYVAGQTQRSRDAMRDLSALLEATMAGRYSLVIVDVLKEPEQAREYDVFATPTLVKSNPPPVRKVVGNFRDPERVLAGLGMRP